MLTSGMKAVVAMANGKRFVARADEKLTAFIDLNQRSVDDCLFSEVGNLMIFVSSSA